MNSGSNNSGSPWQVMQEVSPAAPPCCIGALIGALNGAQVWYRPGRDAPAVIARRFLDMLVPVKASAR